MREGWTYKKLGEICVSDLGKTLNQAKDKGEFRPYLCAINVQWDKIDLSLLKETRFEDNELERYSVKKGDLLVCVKSSLLSIPIPLPPLSLQQSFAAKIEAIEKQKGQISATIKDLETLLASRMQYWFE